VGAQLAVARGSAGSIGVAPSFEHALVVLDGEVTIGEVPLHAGSLGYVAPGRDEIPIASPGGATLLLIGGEPFAEELHMWWNFVARSRAEIDVAVDQWNEHSARFGWVASGLGRIDAPQPPWRRTPTD
jgi:redox-sensitive bicupin YhaK (pirin superfamily)